LVNFDRLDILPKICLAFFVDIKSIVDIEVKARLLNARLLKARLVRRAGLIKTALVQFG
jgi:hypothetical protein